MTAREEYLKKNSCMNASTIKTENLFGRRDQLIIS